MASTQIGGVINEHDMMTSALDYFTKPTIETAMDKNQDLFVYPRASVDAGGPYEFFIQPYGDTLLQLNSLYLHGTVKVQSAAGADLTVAQSVNVSVVNGFAYSLFEKIEIAIDDVTISPMSCTDAHYKAYLQTLISQNTQSLGCELKLVGFTKDGPSRSEQIAIDVVDETADKNEYGENDNNLVTISGWEQRAKLIKASKDFHFVMPVNADLLRSDKMLPMGKTLSVKFTRAPDKFSILVHKDFAANNYTIKVVDLKLYFKRATLTPSLQRSLANATSSHSAHYLLRQTQMKHINIAANVGNVYHMELFRGVLPKFVLFGFVSTDTYAGKVDTDPFYFQNMNLSDITLTLNGTIISSLTPNYTDSEYTFAYHKFIEAIGQRGPNASNLITYRSYGHGDNLYAYDLTPDNCNMYHCHESTNGTIDLQLQFRGASPAKAITMILMGVYDDDFEISPTQIISSNIF